MKPIEAFLRGSECPPIFKDYSSCYCAHEHAQLEEICEEVMEKLYEPLIEQELFMPVVE